MANQRRHTARFKFETVMESLRGEKTKAEICRERNLTKSLLWKWEQAFLERGPAVFENDQAQEQALAERNERIADLERLVGRLTLENDVLKKSETWLAANRRRSER